MVEHAKPNPLVPRPVPAGTTPQATDDQTGMEHAMKHPEPNSKVVGPPTKESK